jgi:branched-subunit amino acid transport protein
MQIDATQFATVTVLIAAGTLALRTAFILPSREARLSPRFLRALAYVPAAMFSALVIGSLHPERVIIPGDLVQLRLPALLLAAIVAMRTKSILWTIVSGMLALWLISWLCSLGGVS